MILSSIDDIIKVEKSKIGQKAKNLLKLNKTLGNVPPFMIIEGSFYEEIIKQFNFENENIISNNLNFLEEKSIELQNQIEKAYFSYSSLNKFKEGIIEELEKFCQDPYIVRSSCNYEDSEKYSFAGIFNSVLNVNKENIILAIMNCFKSAFTKQALFYYYHHNIKLKDLYMGIIIQKMIKPIYSGILITDEIQNQIIIEIIPGNLSNLTGGKEIPARVQINLIDDKKEVIIDPFKLLKKVEPILNELKNSALKIKPTFSQAQEIEWLYDGKLWFVQIRPYLLEDFQKVDIDIKSLISLDSKIKWFKEIPLNSKYYFYDQIFLNSISEISQFSLLTKDSPIKIVNSKLFLSENFKNLVKDDFHQFLKEDKVYELFKQIESSYIKSKNELKSFLKMCENEEIDKKSNDILISTIKIFLELLNSLSRDSFLIRSFIPFFEEYIIREFTGKTEILNKIKPIKLPKQLRFQKELNFIIKNNSNDINSAEKLKNLNKFYHKYLWILNSMGISNFDGFLINLEEFLSKNRVNYLEEIELDYSDELNHFKEILNESEIKLAEIYSKFLFYRTDINDFTNIIKFNFESLINKIIIRENIDRKLFKYLTKDEILILIKIKKYPNDVNKRLDNFILFRIQSEVFLIDKSLDNFEEESKNYNNRYFEGFIVTPGEFKGEIKIIKNIIDFKNIREHQTILLSNLKAIFIPYLVINNLSVICERGGLFSHSAVLSREFNLPCIVGAKAIIKELKDGDIIDVLSFKNNALIFKI